MDYLLLIEGNQTGPYSIGQLREQWASGEITGETLYWREGLAEWKPLEAMADVLEPPPAVPVGFARSAAAAAKPKPSERSRLSFVIIAILFGGLGLHNFYAGYWGRALLQIALLAVGLAYSGTFGILAIWILVECITVRLDAAGRAMSWSTEG